MKLVIDIPEEVYKRTVFYKEFYTLNDCVETIKALEKATPPRRRMTEQTLKDIDRAFKALEERDELLDKIRAEIIKLRSRQNVGVLECLDIIDKYKAESEDKEC